MIKISPVSSSSPRFIYILITCNTSIFLSNLETMGNYKPDLIKQIEMIKKLTENNKRNLDKICEKMDKLCEKSSLDKLCEKVDENTAKITQMQTAPVQSAGEVFVCFFHRSKKSFYIYA